MSENSIKFSLSNSEQRDSWLNSGHQTLDADNFMGVSRPSGPRMLLVPDSDCSVREEEEYWVNSPQLWSWGNLSVDVGLSKAGGGLPWISLGAFGA